MQTRLVWRSQSGHRAWECSDSGLPDGYRRILDLVAGPVPVSKVVEQLTSYSAKQIQDWIDELDTLCFIHSLIMDGEERQVRQAA